MRLVSFFVPVFESGGDSIKIVLITVGLLIMAGLTLMCYACLIVGSDAERQMEEWERERNAGRD